MQCKTRQARSQEPRRGQKKTHPWVRFEFGHVFGGLVIAGCIM